MRPGDKFNLHAFYDFVAKNGTVSIVLQSWEFFGGDGKITIRGKK
jgi:hypothetical protein